jgi:hypothetical protein
LLPAFNVLLSAILVPVPVWLLVNETLLPAVIPSLNVIVVPVNVNAPTDVLPLPAVVIAPALLTVTACDVPPNVFN